MISALGGATNSIQFKGKVMRQEPEGSESAITKG